MHRRTFTIGVMLSLLACTEAPPPRAQAGGRNAFVSGGAISGAFAATGAITLEREMICTATLVSPTRILTAGHCERISDDLMFGLGPTAYSPVVKRRIVEFTRHPSYKKDPGHSTYLHDLAVGVLDHPVTEVKPVVLHVQDPSSLVGQGLVAVGFGSPASSDQSALIGERREATPVLSEVQANVLRYEFAGSGVCHGDSGGPALVKLSKGWRQVGVTSSGETGCRGWGAFTRLDVHADWLARMGINGGERARRCSPDGVCDGSCRADEDCAFLMELSAGNGAPGQGCAYSLECESVCARRADGLGYCTVFCDPAEPSCPEYFVCRPTFDSDDHICAL